MTVTLHALLTRRTDLSHEQFLRHWHDVHGPLIRDTPSLARHLLAYGQHPLLAEAGEFGLDAFDGVTIQRFASWDEFHAFVAEPDARRMDADMGNFLDVGKLCVSVTADPVVVVAAPTSGR